jgi:hypothetical protein
MLICWLCTDTWPVAQLVHIAVTPACHARSTHLCQDVPSLLVRHPAHEHQKLVFLALVQPHTPLQLQLSLKLQLQHLQSWQGSQQEGGQVVSQYSST